MQIKTKDAIKVLMKFKYVTRDTGDTHAKFYHNGKMVLVTKISHGSGDMPCANEFRQQLKLNEDQMIDAIRCPFRYEDYVETLKQKRIIID